VKRKPNILVIDVGGHNIKVADSNHTEPLKLPSGPQMSPEKMVADVKAATAGWNPTAISIGYPGIVTKARIAAEPHNLAPGWVGFDFAAAFGRPVKVVNDAVMQALGGYEGGSMLFLGLGTGLGAAMILDGVPAPMELAHLPYRKGRTFEEYVGQAGLDRLGKPKWQRHVGKVVEMLRTALEPDYVILGGGNTHLLDSSLPEGVRLGSNSNAFLGGQKLWAQQADKEVTAEPAARKGR
jgi:polyphosphate glucokinase